MIKATAKTDKDRYVLIVEGHAGYCPGNDIVCAGISSIIAALFGWVKNYPEQIKELFTVTAEEELRSSAGYAELDLRAKKSFYWAFMTAVIGISQIAAAFPDYVTVDIDEMHPGPVRTETGAKGHKGDTLCGKEKE